MYRRTIARILEMELPTVVYTIYHPAFPEPERLAVTALTAFNDAILRVAFDHCRPVLDLPLICRDPDHYANPVESSAAGGARIAPVIVEAVTSHDFDAGGTSVFAV